MVEPREAPPTEHTSLLGDAAADANAKPNISLIRGLAIMIPMGLLILIQTTNVSMMTTAQSDVAADLDAYAEATWFSSAFMIAVSSIPPLTGRLSKIFMPRSIMLTSSTVLALGLFITAISPNFTIFILGRVLSGCGCGGLTSVTIILALDIAKPSQRGILIGIISLALTTGLSLGAILAGALTPVLGWRFIFWLQAPIALVSGPWVYLALPKAANDNPKGEAGDIWRTLGRVDYVGALTFTTALTLSLTSLASPEILIWPIPLSITLFVVFFVNEAYWAQEPIIPVDVFFTRSVLFTSIAGTGLMMARWGIIFYSPVYTMAVRGWSPASAGLILIPTNAGFGVGGLLVGVFHIRKADSYYLSCLVTFAVYTVSTWTLAMLSTPDSPASLYMISTFVNGLAAGALMNYQLSHMLHLTNTSMHFIVTAIFTTFRGFSASAGSAIGGGLFTRVLKGALETGFEQYGLPPQPNLVRTLLGSPATVMQLDGVKQLVAIQSYGHAIRALLWAGGGLTVLATLLQAGTGWKAPRDEESDNQ